MTVALEYKKKQQKQIIDEYIEKFGYKALEFKAGSLGILCECDGEWKIYKEFPLNS